MLFQRLLQLLKGVLAHIVSRRREVRVKLIDIPNNVKNGWEPDELDPRDEKYRHDLIFGAEFVEKLPETLNLKNMPPTSYQDGVPECVLATQAWIQAFNSLREGIEFKGSPRYNFGKTGGWSGRAFRPTLQFLREVGMPEYDLCPADFSLSHNQYLDVSHYEDSALLSNAKIRRIKNFEKIELTQELLKQATYRSPIQVAVEIRENWDADIIHWSDKPTGVYHSIAIYDWNDMGKYWKIGNWNRRDGKDYRKLSYDYRILAAMALEDIPDELLPVNNTIHYVKDFQTTGIWLCRELDKSRILIAIDKSYWALTHDLDWKGIEVWTEDQLNQYKVILGKKFYAFEY